MFGSSVLIADSDELARQTLAANFSRQGYEVHETGTCCQALQALDSGSIGVLVLELTLADEDGLVLIRRLRRRSLIPIIVHTRRSNSEERLSALELGVDDYLNKDIAFEELALRVRNLLKRCRKEPNVSRCIRTLNGYYIDICTRRLWREGGGKLELTPAEFDALATLVLAEGTVVPRAELLDAVTRREPPHAKTVDVLISRLRRKLESGGARAPRIITAPRYGYRLPLEENTIADDDSLC